MSNKVRVEKWVKLICFSGLSDFVEKSRVNFGGMLNLFERLKFGILFSNLNMKI
jgi:hypothetical protein